MIYLCSTVFSFYPVNKNNYNKILQGSQLVNFIFICNCCNSTSNQKHIQLYPKAIELYNTYLYHMESNLL